MTTTTTTLRHATWCNAHLPGSDDGVTHDDDPCRHWLHWRDQGWGNIAVTKDGVSLYAVASDMSADNARDMAAALKRAADLLDSINAEATR